VSAENQTDFEDGKQVEDYIDELNTLNIEPEHSSEATQRVEDVAEAPVRNQKEQRIRKLVKAEETQPFPNVPQQSVPKETLITPEPPTPQHEPVIQQKPMTIDEYIKMQGEMVKQQYVENGEVAKQAFIQNSYRNLAAVINGEVALVPVQQIQSQPEPQPTPAIPVDGLDEQIHRIDIALKDPLLEPEHKALLERKKLKLLGINLEDILPQPQSVPVNPKPVTEEKQKKPLTKANKAIIGCMGIAVVVLVVLVIGYLV
jgi:hypothetical protein